MFFAFFLLFPSFLFLLPPPSYSSRPLSLRFSLGYSTSSFLCPPPPPVVFLPFVLFFTRSSSQFFLPSFVFLHLRFLSSSHPQWIALSLPSPQHPQEDERKDCCKGLPNNSQGITPKGSSPPFTTFLFLFTFSSLPSFLPSFHLPCSFSSPTSPYPLYPSFLFFTDLSSFLSFTCLPFPIPVIFSFFTLIL